MSCMCQRLLIAPVTERKDEVRSGSLEAAGWASLGASAGHKSAKDFSEQQPWETRVTLPLTGWAVSGEELPYKVSERGQPGLTAEV